MAAVERDKPSGRQSDSTAQQTRQRILQSARTIFAARGFDGVSVRDIAAHAAVTHGLVRHHFGSKEAVWCAVVDATLDEYLALLTPLVAAAAVQHAGALPTLRMAVRTVILLTARHPEIARLLLHESVVAGPRLDYFLQQITPIRALMAPIIDAVQREGGLPQFTHDTFLLSVLMLGTMPFALVAFSNALCDIDILAAEQIEQHADRVIATLFPDSAPQAAPA